MSNLARTGWLLFLAGCVLFTVQGIVNRDPMTFVGGALFTIGCGALLVDGNRYR